MARPHGKGEREIIEERRVQIARKLLEHKSQRQIARELDVGVTTINRDIGVIRHEWRKELLRDYSDLVATEMAKLEVAEEVVMAALYQGDQNAVQRLIMIMQRRATMLGLDHEHGLAERQVKVEEEKARVISEAFRDTLDELGVPASVRDLAPKIFARRLRALPAAPEQ